MSGPVGAIVSTNAMPGALLRRRAQSLEQTERRSHAADGKNNLSAYFSLGLSYLLRKQAVKENGPFSTQISADAIDIVLSGWRSWRERTPDGVCESMKTGT